MPRTEKYFIGPALLGEIRSTISRVAGMPDKTGISQAPVRLQELQRLAIKNVRACSWTGTWSIGQTHQIELIGATQTATAVNSYFGWKDNGSVGSGVVLKQSGVWQLHNIDPQTVQGITAIQSTAVGAAAYGVLGCEVIYDPNPPPGETSGASDQRAYLRWFAVTQCST